jgi:hypothetical protein
MGRIKRKAESEAGEMIGNCFGNDPIDRELERSADAALERWVSGCVGKDCERCKHYGQMSCINNSYEPSEE